MRRYTSSEARRNFATILEQARREGVVRIERRDGQAFLIVPDRVKRSPLDVPGVTLDPPVTLEEILQAVREGRERYG